MFETDCLMYNTQTMKKQLYFESREWQTQVSIIFILSFYGKTLLSKNHQKMLVYSEKATGLCEALRCIQGRNLQCRRRKKSAQCGHQHWGSEGDYH